MLERIAAMSLASTVANTDEGLIRQIAAGDRDAMRLLYHKHSAPVFRYVARMVRNEALADDLISEVFMDVWQQAGRFEGRSSVSTWLIGIARYKALSALRKPRHGSLDDDDIAESLVDDADDPEVLKQKQDKSGVLRKCLALLSREHREIVDLVYYHEMSIDEAAAVIGIPENTVKTRLFYARKRLAEIAKTNGLDRGWP
jgi:RNA polymerase sigma-70 factor (ECF subfamily)